MGRRRTGTRQGNVYRSVREKQENVVSGQRVLQTVTSLRVVSAVFRGHNPLKITNINPQQETRFLLWKKLDYSRERRKWSLDLGQHLKGTSPDVGTESGSSREISEFSIFLKVARYSFSRSIPPKFEHKLRRHKQRFGKIDTTVVLDKDENLL